MAKKSAKGVNKSELIRNYMAANPSAKPKAVAEVLSAQTGVKFSPTFVSTIKTADKKRGGKKPGKRGRKPGRPAAAAPSSSIEQLIKAKKLVDQLGSVDAARAAVNALAQLLG